MLPARCLNRRSRIERLKSTVDKDVLNALCSLTESNIGDRR
jgi:hypothetical protein